jgi:hypothetical protein
VIYPLVPAAVMPHWPQAARVLAAAFEHSELDTATAHLPQLLRDLEQLWRIHGKAWAITRIADGKHGRVLVFVACAGEEMDSWLADFVARAEEWARKHGCTRSLIQGRRGWARALPQYRTTHVTLTREI